MQLPLWFSLWQSLDSLLAIALNAAEAFPFLLFLCLFLFRSRRAPFLADSGRIFLKLGLICAVIGAGDLLLRGLVDLEFLPAALDKLEPLPFEPFSSPWLGTTTTLAAWIAGIVLLYLTGNGARTLFLTSGMGTDEDTARRLSKKAGLLSAGAFIAFVCFFASIITRNWPFLGLPEQMTQQRVAEVLLAHAWRMTCGSLMPAGALAILAFFFSITNGTFRNASGDEKKPALLEDEDARTLRMICAAAIAGGAFQFLDAGFVAFSYSSGLGVGIKSSLMRFGPFFTTGLSLACWVFLFARPRRDAFFLALLPVLLILFKAALRF